MKKVVIIMALLVSMAAPVLANPTRAELWKSLSASEKAILVAGTINGFVAGWLSGYVASGVKVYRVSDKQPYFSKSNTAYVALVDDYYARFGNTTDVMLGSVMTCLQDTPRISCEQMAHNVAAQQNHP